MGSTRLVITIPQDSQGNWQNSIERLRADQQRFSCRDLGTLVEHLGRLGLSGEIREDLNRSGYSFLFWETDRTDIDRLIEEIEIRHNDPTFSQPNIGFVKHVEREPEFHLGSVEPELKLGTNFTFDQTWRTEYVDKMMQASSTGYDGNGIRIVIIDTGAEPHTPGVQGFFDVFNNNPSGWENSAATPNHWQDGSGHGTAMARIINYVAPQSRLYAFRAVVAKVARLMDVMAAVAAAVNAVAPHIINLSLSIPEADCPQCGTTALSRNRAFRDFLSCMGKPQSNLSIPAMLTRSQRIALRLGCPPLVDIPEPVYVAATGNKSNSDGLYLPARYDFTLAVGAIDSKYQRAAYSNWGTPPSQPQKDGYIMLPGGKYDDQDNAAEYIGYATDGPDTRYCIGTSPATALATGLLALYMQQLNYSHQGARWMVDKAINNCDHNNINNYTKEEYGQGLFFWQ